MRPECSSRMIRIIEVCLCRLWKRFPWYHWGVHDCISKRVVSNRLRARLGAAAPLLVPVFNLLLPPVLGVRPDELRPVDRIGEVLAPLLVLSGARDDRTLLAEAASLFDRAPEPKAFWAVKGAAHVDLEAHGPPEYWSRVLPFLTRHLRAPGG